uniref:Uncharacterized protein n=1 Tax=Arundo donax TaxID=35708 RepID=A0A0A9BK59_ARUDO
MNLGWKTLDMKAQRRYMQQLISCRVIWFLSMSWLCNQKNYLKGET